MAKLGVARRCCDRAQPASLSQAEVVSAIDKISDKRVFLDDPRERLQLTDDAKGGAALEHFGIGGGPPHPHLNGLSQEIADGGPCGRDVAEEGLKPIGLVIAENSSDLDIDFYLPLGEQVPVRKVLALDGVVEGAGPEEPQHHADRPSPRGRGTQENASN